MRRKEKIMKQLPFISGENQIALPPVGTTTLLWLVMDKLQVSEAVWYVVWTVWTLWFIGISSVFLIGLFKGRKHFTVDEEGKIEVRR